MSTIKTLANDSSVEDFIDSVDNATRRADGHTLLQLFTKITGQPAQMWGTSIVGFGRYHYKSERSSQEGDWPLLAFSPRKQNMTVYIMPGFEAYGDLLNKLGKHKTSVSCLYINKLSDINIDILAELATVSYQRMKKLHAQ